MTLVLRRFFGYGVSSLRMPFMSDNRVSVAQIKQQLRMLLRDCSDKSAQRVAYRISGALTADELWQIRSELHQCISRRHSQTEAALRINSLLPAFTGWMPARQLMKI
jgi:hypothetical protein